MASGNSDDTCPNWRKISWVSLSNIIKQDDLAKLRRSVSQESIYKKFIQDLKREWISVHDYILHTKFNYEAVPEAIHDEPGVNFAESNLKWRAEVPKDKSILQTRILTENDFPYDFEDGIEHWCLWKLGSDLTTVDISWGMDELRNRDDYEDMLYWINPVNLKSLPNIDHAHIVCLRSDRDR